jgi:hypothetical protein
MSCMPAAEAILMRPLQPCANLPAGALVISNDAFFASRTEMLAALALRHGVPTIFQFREFAAAGGLMTYGWGIPSTRAIAGAKLQSDLLVAIRNP